MSSIWHRIPPGATTAASHALKCSERMWNLAMTRWENAQHPGHHEDVSRSARSAPPAPQPPLLTMESFMNHLSTSGRFSRSKLFYNFAASFDFFSKPRVEHCLCVCVCVWPCFVLQLSACLTKRLGRRAAQPLKVTGSCEQDVNPHRTDETDSHESTGLAEEI